MTLMVTAWMMRSPVWPARPSPCTGTRTRTVLMTEELTSSREARRSRHLAGCSRSDRSSPTSISSSKRIPPGYVSTAAIAGSNGASVVTSDRIKVTIAALTTSSGNEFLDHGRARDPDHGPDPRQDDHQWRPVHHRRRQDQLQLHGHQHRQRHDQLDRRQRRQDRRGAGLPVTTLASGPPRPAPRSTP